MSTPADDATKPSGNSNSISSASAGGERSVIPGERENRARRRLRRARRVRQFDRDGC